MVFKNLPDIYISGINWHGILINGCKLIFLGFKGGFQMDKEVSRRGFLEAVAKGVAAFGAASLVPSFGNKAFAREVKYDPDAPVETFDWNGETIETPVSNLIQDWISGDANGTKEIGEGIAIRTRVGPNSVSTAEEYLSRSLTEAENSGFTVPMKVFWDYDEEYKKRTPRYHFVAINDKGQPEIISTAYGNDDADSKIGGVAQEYFQNQKAFSAELAHN